MRSALLLFVLGLLLGLSLAATVSLFLGRRVVRPDGSPARRRGPVRLLLGAGGVATVLLLTSVAVGWFYASAQFARIEKVPVHVDGRSVLAGSSRGTNHLLVGTDNREGFEGNRADTILVLRTGDGPARFLSIPRDLRVPLPSRGGEENRINAAYNDGPIALIQAVQESVGIPIDRYIEINFGSFAGLVDALGGVTIHFENPAIDTHSGLNVPVAGDVLLDGEQSLAYVRSRFYQEVIDGEVQPSDGLADLSRVVRQQTFLRAVLAEAGSSRNPFHLNRIGSALIGGLRVDEHMELLDALVFAWNMGRLDPVSTELPIRFIPNSGQVALAPEAQAVIDDFAS